MIQPLLTVLVASRNGATRIASVLDAYIDQQIAGPRQLIVVNNNSTDDAVQIVEAYRNKLPLAVIDEPVAGKNRALNAGLPHITGQLIITPDDDAIPHPGFLRRAAVGAFKPVFLEGHAVSGIVRLSQSKMAFSKAQTFRHGRSNAVLDRKAGAPCHAPWKYRSYLRAVSETLHLVNFKLRATSKLDLVYRSFGWWSYYKRVGCTGLNE